MQAHAVAGPQEVDPAVAKRKAAEEEERRLAEIRAHGTPVNAQTFAAWKTRWDAELAFSQANLQVGTQTWHRKRELVRAWACADHCTYSVPGHCAYAQSRRLFFLAKSTAW